MNLISDYNKVKHLVEQSDKMDNIELDAYNTEKEKQKGGNKTKKDLEKEYYDIYNRARQYQNRNRGIYDRQMGGEKSESSRDLEKEYHDIYNRAKQYQDKISKVIEKMPQTGGEIGPKIRLMLDLSSKMKDINKYAQFKQPEKMKISGYIIQDAMKETDSEEVNQKVREKSFKLLDNQTDKYIDRYHKENPEGLKKKTKSKSKKKIKKFHNFERQDVQWKGNNGNYREYAQSNMWKDNNIDSDYFNFLKTGRK